VTTIAAEPTTEPMSAQKRLYVEHADAIAAERNAWIDKNSAYYKDDQRYMGFMIPKGQRVLDLGCGTGRLLAGLEPSYGVGVDFSPRMIEVARKSYPQHQFIVADMESEKDLAMIEGTFDYVVLSDTIGMLEDIEVALKRLHRFFHAETRLVISYYSSYWGPILSLATLLGRRMPQPEQNLLSLTNFLHILNLSDFEPIRMEWRQLVPFSLLGIGRLINRFIAPLPIIRNFCLRGYVVARSRRVEHPPIRSSTILIPCRNERGNIERAVLEMPRFGEHQEILFVEGNSSDDTYEECLRVRDAYKDAWDIKVLKQDGKGKGDAVRKGFAHATGDILMILDADLTMPAAELPKFYDAIANDKAEFVNGTRLVYPKEDEAMRFLNHIANRLFALIFSFLLNQRFTDTLCGTKVLRKRDYDQIVANRGYFGDFDPFGDFDLIFGAAKLNLRIIEVPIHYKARTYGSPQISRFRDGWLLLRMVAFAYRKLKAI
jgi:SAM-dependent methyltransferase